MTPCPYGGWPQRQTCGLELWADHCERKALAWFCGQTVLLEPLAGFNHHRLLQPVRISQYSRYRDNQVPSNPGTCNCVFSTQCRVPTPYRSIPRVDQPFSTPGPSRLHMDRLVLVPGMSSQRHSVQRGKCRWGRHWRVCRIFDQCH
jgi:hypothetical protein